MMTKRKKYFPNNWKPIKDAPEEAFPPIEFEDFMDWKIGGYEIPQDVACLLRVKNLDTGKVKEHVYQLRHAAKKKCRKLMSSGNYEVVVVQRDTVHFLYPAENDVFD
tara:strand:+ start:233 stop:553 length:321 start_codon:yes stop_codon:yes gene_type:complete